MRTIIEVPQDVIESLDRVGCSENKSRAALIREAIAEYLRQKTLPQAEAAFGLWKRSPKDSLQYQNRLRSEFWTSPIGSQKKPSA